MTLKLWVEISRWLLAFSPFSDVPIIPNIPRYISHESSEFHLKTSLENLLEIWKLYPPQFYWLGNYTITIMPGDPKHSKFKKEGLVDSSTTGCWNPWNDRDYSYLMVLTFKSLSRSDWLKWDPCSYLERLQFFFSPPYSQIMLPDADSFIAAPFINLRPCGNSRPSCTPETSLDEILFH